MTDLSERLEKAKAKAIEDLAMLKIIAATGASCKMSALVDATEAILALIKGMQRLREQRDFLYDSGLIADDRAFDDAEILREMEKPK